MELFTGSGVALVTPFTEDLQVDYSKFEALIGFHLKHQTDALIVCGTTGEAPTISDDEKLKLFELAVKTVQGRVPIIAGTGSNDTRHVIEMSKKAQALGVDALLVVTPYYNKSSQAGLVAHFTAIADAYEVMTNGRPYKKSMSFKEVKIEFERCSGIHFDPELVDIFLAIHNKMPVNPQ